MNKKPKVGIIIPNYGRINYLKETVKSAISQTYKNLEIIIIDDHSPGETIRNYLKKINDTKVKWFINKTNLGTTKNFNKGVKLLKRDVQWCVILNNDDYLDKNFIKEAIKTHQKFPQSKVIHCHQVFVNADKKTKSEDKDFSALETAEDYLVLRSLGKREIRSPSVFFNLNQFKKIGGYPSFPSGMCTDSVFIFALAFDNKLAFSEKSLVYIRIHEKAESETAANLKEKLLSVKQMHDYCRKVYLNNPRSDHQNKKKVFRALKYYNQFLSPALLMKKYRELMKKKPKKTIKKDLQMIVRFCKKNRIYISPRFFILANIFNHFGVNIEKFRLYNYVNYSLLKLNKTERSIRHFLLKKFNIYP